MAGLYRENAKSSMSDPGELDSMITVVPKKFWMILAGCALLMVLVGLWSVFGTLTETVNATGVYHPGSSPDGEVIAFLPLASGKTISEGMSVTLYPAGYNMQANGNLKGTVTYVDSYTASVEEVRRLLGDDLLANAFLQNGPIVTVICRLQEDPTSANGYLWSNPGGKEIVLHDGTYMSMSIATETYRPISVGIPTALRRAFQ